MKPKIKITRAAAAIALQKKFVKNILAVYKLAQLEDHIAGNNWYYQAQAISRALAETTGLDPMVIAGVIAAISPQNKWDRNVFMAEQVLRVWRETGVSALKQKGYFKLGLTKVDQILALADPTHEQVCTILNGQKITAFFRCISGDLQGVCVDGHAFNIATHGLVRKGISSVKSFGVARYRALELAYQTAATKMKITPAQLQAITWITYRNLSI